MKAEDERRIRELIERGFFDEEQTINRVADELGESRGRREAIRFMLDEATAAGLLVYVGNAMCNEWIRPEKVTDKTGIGNQIRAAERSLVRRLFGPGIAKSLEGAAATARAAEFTIEEFLDLARDAYNGGQ